MLRNLFLATAAAATLGTHAFAQTEPAAPAATTTAAPTAAPSSATVNVGVEPLADVPAPNFVAWSWDSNAFEIATAKIALRKASRPDVKAYAQSMLTAHETMQKTLAASLKNDTRVFTQPNDALSPQNAALVDQLEKAPAASFDNLYLTQQVAAHQKAWAITKGFANVGQDEALKTVATASVPMIEQHFAQVQGLVPASLAAK